MKRLVPFLMIVIMLVSCVSLFSACGNSSNDNETKPKNCSHAYSKTSSEATCYLGGYATYKCSLCGDSYTKYESSTGHDYIQATCTSPKKCSKCDYTYGNALGHTTDNGTCSRCYTYIGKKWTKSEVQSIIKVYDVWVDEINSAGGVDMEIGWENTSSKTIKYIHFYVEPYNAVGDVVCCEIRDTSKFRAYSTGPYEPGYNCYDVFEYSLGTLISGMHWSCCWYNNTVKYINLYQIKIEYMDGTSVTIGEDAIQYAFVN